MNPQPIQCPSCGATHDVLNPGVVTVVCEYCGNAVYWDTEKIEDAGRQSILPEGFTRLYRGAAGRLAKRRFTVMGRVRYSFGKGFWDEWFLSFDDDTIGWLTEDNHELALQNRTALKQAPALASLKPGRKFKAQGIDFVVQEVGQAECIRGRRRFAHRGADGRALPLCGCRQPGRSLHLRDRIRCRPAHGLRGALVDLPGSDPGR